MEEEEKGEGSGSEEPMVTVNKILPDPNSRKNCYTENFLVHIVDERTFNTGWFLETEEEHVEFTKSIIFNSHNHVEESRVTKHRYSHFTDDAFVLYTNASIEVENEDDTLLLDEERFYEDVSVINPTLKKNFLKKFVTYTLRNGKDEDIERRYSEFYMLRKVLVRNFPGCYIPNVPGKKYYVNRLC